MITAPFLREIDDAATSDCFEKRLGQIYLRGRRGPPGMMISRRPNSRASHENAPGPSITSAIDNAANTKDVDVLSTWFIAWFCSAEIPLIRLTSATIAPPIGVRNPAMSATPLKISIKPKLRSICVRLNAATAGMPCMSALTPTQIRMRIRPAPGHPSGKIEKNFCRVSLRVSGYVIARG